MVSNTKENDKSTTDNRPSLQLEIIEISSDSEDDADVFCQLRPCKSRSAVQEENLSDFVWKNDVIELTDSESGNSSGLPEVLSPLIKGPRRKKLAGSRKRPSSEEFIPLYVDTSDDGRSDKDCILVLNDPSSSRRPIRTVPPPKGRDAAKAIPLFDSPKKNFVPEPSQVVRNSPSKRTGRSALRAIEQARRQKYATELFAQLNKDVFGDRLPKDTTLEWSKRLLTTAGRARWHRSREGEHTTKIELASKILDCDERIRNTLSHEMCHLACWVIDDQPREGHGQLFKSWARKVMHKHPDIRISTRHTYEISYPYEWKCETCSKIYGRHSKSIRPDECLCGRCKVGKLIALFVEKRAMTPKVSRMAVAKPPDSPYSAVGGPSKNRHVVQQPSPPSSDLDDNDISGLANALGSITIDKNGDC